MTNLALVPIHDVSPVQPAAMHELSAAKYLGMSRTAFRGIVRKGRVPYSEHVNGRTRIYLRSDLDDYLRSLTWRKMELREVSRTAPKGV